MRKNKFLIILCFLCLGFIFFNSSQTGNESNVRSNNMVDKAVTVMAKADSNILQKEINNKKLNLLIRKCAHAFEFSILAIIISLTLNDLKIDWKNRIIYTLFIVLLCAVLDELFQLDVPGRSSSVLDVLIDFFGGIIACICFQTIRLYLSKNKMHKSL